MEEHRHGLGEAGKRLNLKKPMRSRISDILVPPPVFQKAAVDRRYEPKAVAEKMRARVVSLYGVSEFEARFQLHNGKGFTLRGDKEGFGSIQSAEPFREVHERLLREYHRDIIKIDVFAGDEAVTFSSYDDMLEWLEI